MGLRGKRNSPARGRSHISRERRVRGRLLLRRDFFPLQGSGSRRQAATAPQQLREDSNERGVAFGISCFSAKLGSCFFSMFIACRIGRHQAAKYDTTAEGRMDVSRQEVPTNRHCYRNTAMGPRPLLTIKTGGPASPDRLALYLIIRYNTLMYINLNDHNVYYQKVGTGKKPLVMLHGWGQDVSTFWPVVDKLKVQFTLYLIDLPGFGRSDNPKYGFKNEDYADIIHRFITDLKLKSPVLLGHSVGGRIGIKLSAKYPQDLSKLILVASAGIKPKRDLLKTLIYPLAKLSRLMPNWFNFRERLRKAFYRTLEADYINAGPLRETLKNILEEDLLPQLIRVKTDSLLIWGEKDPTKEASVKNGKIMYRKIENSRIEVFEGVGHFPHLEKPDLFAYFVRDFAS